MNIGLNFRENALVTTGDAAMFARDQVVFDKDTGCLVPAGVFVAMDIKTLKSIDITDLPTLKNPIRVGVSLGVGKNIRWGAGEEFYPGTIKTMTAMPAKCGTPEVVDLWFKCTQCFTDYMIKVDIRDNDTKSFSSSATDFEPYYANARPDCGSCGECSFDATCAVVQEALVEELQGVFDELDKKASVTAIYDNSFIYCFKPSGYACGTGCADYNGVAEFTPDGTGNTTLVDTEVPATMDELLLKLSQLKTAIEADVNFVGSVAIAGGYGDSCCVQLHINTPNTFVLTDSAAVVVACDTTTPQASHPDMCGIRVIGAPITDEFGCLIGKDKSDYGREINIYAVSDSFEDAIVEKIYELSLPQNFGDQVYHMEYNQNNGGQGRVYDNSNNMLDDGYGFTPGSRSRALNAITFADRTKSYVSLHVEHTIPHTAYGMRGNINPAPVTLSLYIPECDTTTSGSVVPFFNEMGKMAGLLGAISIAEADHPSVEGENISSKLKEI